MKKIILLIIAFATIIFGNYIQLDPANSKSCILTDMGFLLSITETHLYLCQQFIHFF